MKRLSLILAFLFSLSALATTPSIRELASIEEENRLEHARELMGNRYIKSAVKSAEDQDELEESILETIEERLPKKFKDKAHDIAETIITEANKHSLDPFFLMAIIAGESNFKPLAKGPVGEIGLMQLRPSTAKWIAQMNKLKWNGEKDLRDPVKNIILGTAYISWLREKFEGHGQLYLAAYNMGPKNVKQALSKNIRPKDYTAHVMKRYLGFYKKVASENI